MQTTEQQTSSAATWPQRPKPERVRLLLNSRDPAAGGEANP
ncbi:MAG TPA: hypothetical protein VMW52_04365 [Phycisphaerae bacterium]|nr:hypothetical protein [Phycisphaerae bacterium]